MKVGILTYHRSHNYGALLQAIATRLVLESLGHEAYYVDYWPGYHRRMYALVNERLLFTWRVHRVFLYLLRGVLYVLKCKKRRRANMNRFIRRYIEPYCKPVSDYYDVILYGSDQIWRKQREGVGYNPVYFGQNTFMCGRHITYAASMGILPGNQEDAERVRSLVSGLDRISVREESLKDFLYGIGIHDVHVCLDPVLLLSSSQWNKVFQPVDSPRGKYVLFYNLLSDSFDRNDLEDFASKRHCRLKVLHSKPIHKETQDDICTVSPEGFVDLVRNAEFIFTSSFHGLVFAITYRKPFLASFSRNVDRAKSILCKLGLSDRLIPPMDKIPQYIKPIDYRSVEEDLEKIREESIQYLIRSLS